MKDDYPLIRPVRLAKEIGVTKEAIYYYVKRIDRAKVKRRGTRIFLTARQAEVIRKSIKAVMILNEELFFDTIQLTKIQ